MNTLDQFEKNLKNSVEGFEVPYNSSDWDNLVSRMDERKGGGTGAGMYVAFLAGALLLGGSLYYAFNSNNEQLAEIEQIQQAADEKLNNEAEETSVAFNSEQSDLDGSGDAALNESQAIDSANDTADENDAGGIESKSTSAIVPETTPEVIEEKPIRVIRKGKQEPTPLEAISTHNGVVSENGTSSENNSESGLGFTTSVEGSCSGTAISFKLDKVKDGVIYLWNFGDGSFSDKPEPEHVYQRAGQYSVTLSMTSQSGGMIENKQASDKKIEIFDAPNASFIYASRDEIKKLPYVHFENNSTSAVRWEWDFGDGTKSTESHPDHLYRKAGTYQVTLSVENAEGCTDQLTLPVVVTKDNDLKAPGTFSPNGDGLKDTFMPEALKELEAPFKLSVFETTGKLIYTSSDVRRPWNGRSQEGQGELMPAGDYVWVVDFVGGKYSGESFQGKVTLLQ